MRHLLGLVFIVGVALSTPESDELYNEFNSATEEILAQLNVATAPTAPTVSLMAQPIEESAFEGSEMKSSPKFQMLEDLPTSLHEDDAHFETLASTKDAVKESYQDNVKTIYTHLEEIIKKILGHKKAWTQKYNDDLLVIANQVLKHKNAEKEARDKAFEAKGKFKEAEEKADYAGKKWTVAKDLLSQKQTDATKMRKEIKELYVSGLKQITARSACCARSSA